MTSFQSSREMGSDDGRLLSAWCVAAFAFIMMQSAILLSGPSACPNPDNGAASAARPAKSDLAGQVANAPYGPVDNIDGARYYRCFERPAEKKAGSFVIGLSCVWPGDESSAGG